MYEPDGYNGYEGGAPYWITPSGSKTYDPYEAQQIHDDYFNNKK